MTTLEMEAAALAAYANLSAALETVADEDFTDLNTAVATLTTTSATHTTTLATHTTTLATHTTQIANGEARLDLLEA